VSVLYGPDESGSTNSPSVQVWPCDPDDLVTGQAAWL
jgi:hypothetical protein